MRDRVAGNAFTYFVGGVSQERIRMHTSAESSMNVSHATRGMEPDG
jgi:hypothetical protein